MAKSHLSDFDAFARHPGVADPRIGLAAAAVFLAMELPLALIYFRSSHRYRRLLLPATLYAVAVFVPNPGWKALLFLGSLFVIFALAIGTRFRETRTNEERQLVVHGRSQWLGQSRQTSTSLIGAGAAMMIVATLADAIARARSIPTVLLFASGTLLVGLGLVRPHTVLVVYLGRKRARWLEVVQVTAAAAAYGLAVAGEVSPDVSRRLIFRLLTLAIFALHYRFVWLPLMKVEERTLPGTSTG